MRKFLVAYRDFDIIDIDIFTYEVVLNEGEKANVDTFINKLIDRKDIPQFTCDIISWSLIEE